ncbi:MAG: response regulator [Cyanobacteria bacterium P01_F01_bin.150]
MSFNILLVDDSPTDAAILQASFDDFTEQQQIQVLTSGVAMLQFIENYNSSSCLPALILLDLNLPQISGHELLKTLKAHQTWGLIPVIILSSSSAPSDIAKSYALHANAYITKPKSFEEYQKMAKKIYSFWQGTVTLPLREHVFSKSTSVETNR